REVGLVVAVLLLERAGVVLVRGYLPGDGDEGGGVVERVAERDGEQHRPRAGRGVDGDQLAGGPEVGVRHVPRRRLNAWEDDLQLVLVVVHAVEQADRPVPGVAEQVRHLFLDQVLDDEVTAADFRHLASLYRVRGPEPPRGNYTTGRLSGALRFQWLIVPSTYPTLS